MSKKISFEKFHHSQQKQPRPRLTSVNDSFALRERVVDRRSFHPSNVSWPSSSGPKGFAGLFLASWTRGISSIFPLISDKATLDCLSPHSSFSGFAGIIRPINGNSLCLSLSPFPLLFLYLSFRHRSRATRTDPVTLWIAGIHEGNSIFRIVRDEALPHGLATPLLFSSSHFRRICADLAARYAINRRNQPSWNPRDVVDLSLDPLITIGIGEGGWKFWGSQLGEDYLFQDPNFQVNIASKEDGFDLFSGLNSNDYGLFGN